MTPTRHGAPRLISALLLLLTLLLAACGAGPDVDALRKSVDERLAQALPAGTVELASLTRRGSQADTKAPAGETRRVIYYDAQLRLKRDFDFGAWDAPGVAGLISAFGAGPKGISGIASGGNKAGDMLTAHGTMLFRRDGERWVPAITGGYKPPEAPDYATTAVTGPAAVLDAMRKIVEAVPKGGSPNEQAIIEEELQQSYTNIQARLARAEKGYAIAAGQEHGQYLRLVRAVVAGTPERSVALITHGGEENVRLLRDGKVSFALAQGDSALDAYEGKGAFAADGPYISIRAVGSLYPEAVHIVVRDADSIRTVADLRGKRVAVGEAGSASRTTALRVLQAHGIGLSDIDAQPLAIGEALVALRESNVDAVVQIIGVPADAIRDALTGTPLRLLPLSPQAIATLAGSGRGYFPYTITRGAYSNLRQDVQTVATAALLLTASNLSDVEVSGVTDLVYRKARDFTALGSAQGALISAGNAAQGLTVPQHLAAARELDAIRAGKPAVPEDAKPAPAKSE